MTTSQEALAQSGQEKKELLQMLTETEAIVADLRKQVASLKAENEALKEAGGNDDSFEKLRKESEDRLLAINKFTAQILRTDG